MTIATRYFRTGPMTQDKLEWIQKQIEGLQQANRELADRLNRDSINLNVNERQIEALRIILRRNGG
jgi:hypothetical protein